MLKALRRWVVPALVLYTCRKAPVAIISAATSWDITHRFELSTPLNAANNGTHKSDFANWSDRRKNMISRNQIRNCRMEQHEEVLQRRAQIEADWRR